MNGWKIFGIVLGAGLGGSVLTSLVLHNADKINRYKEKRNNRKSKSQNIEKEI